MKKIFSKGLLALTFALAVSTEAPAQRQTYGEAMIEQQNSDLGTVKLMFGAMAALTAGVIGLAAYKDFKHKKAPKV